MADLTPQPNDPMPNAAQPPGQQIPVNANQATLLDPEGNIVIGPTSGVQTALASGYKLATPQNIQEAQNQQQFGEGIGNKVKAAALGAGEGATFGLSTLALTKSGLVDPNTISQIEERNPISHGVGQVGGILGSSALLPGGGLVGGVSKLGNAVSEGAASLGSGLIQGAGDGLIGKALGAGVQIGSKGLGSALEGSLYSGVGNTITEAALGDPDLNAEKVLSNFGYGAIVGGVLGSAVKAGELSLPPAYDAAKNALGDFYNWAVGKPEEVPGPIAQGAAKASSIVSGVPTEDILTGLQKRAAEPAESQITDLQAKMTANLTNLNSEVSKTVEGAIPDVSSVGTKTTSYLNGLQSKMKGLLSTFYNDVKPQEVENLLAETPIEQVAPAGDKVSKLLQDNIDTMQANPAAYPAHYAAVLQQTKDLFENTINSAESPTAPFLFKTIDGLKKQIGDGIPFNRADPPLAIRQMQEVYAGLKNILQDQDTWGPQAARQAALNSAYSDFSQSGKVYKKYWLSPVDGNVNPGTVENYIANPNSPVNYNRGLALASHLKNYQTLLGEIKNSYENVPTQALNIDDINALLQKQNESNSLLAQNHIAQGQYAGVQGAQQNFENAFVAKPTGTIDPQKVGNFIKNSGAPINDTKEGIFNNYLSEIQKLADNPNGGISQDSADKIKGYLNNQYDIAKKISAVQSAQNASKALNTNKTGLFGNMLEMGFIAHNPLLAVPIEVAKMAANPGLTISRLLALEKITNAVTGAVEKGAKGLFSAADVGLNATKGLLAEDYTHQKLLQKHQAFANGLRQNMADPEGMINTVSNATLPLYQAAPKTADSLNNITFNAANFLQSKLPIEQKGGILNETEPPSETEISNFNRYKTIVEQPLKIFDQLKDNSITPQSIEAMQAVYPNLLNEIKTNVANNIAGLKNPNEIPYPMKLNLSMLLGEPLDQSLNPASIASNQHLISASNLQQQPQQAPKRSNVKGLSKLTLSERSQTNFQQAATRQAQS